MQKKSVLITFCLSACILACAGINAQTEDGKVFEKDVVQTSGGELAITFVGHGSLMFAFNDLIIHVDPVSREADYTKMPKADIILITHNHSDHLDSKAIGNLKKNETIVLGPENVVHELANASVIRNGETHNLRGLQIEAVPAYNIKHKRDTGEPYHIRGQGNGYVISFTDTRVYVAGDTENVPEIKRLRDIDVAFLPMNLPYTMTPEMVADVAKAIRPEILYPYHFSDTDPNELKELLSEFPRIEVRIRDMK